MITRSKLSHMDVVFSVFEQDSPVGRYVVRNFLRFSTHPLNEDDLIGD